MSGTRSTEDSILSSIPDFAEDNSGTQADVSYSPNDASTRPQQGDGDGGNRSSAAPTNTGTAQDGGVGGAGSATDSAAQTGAIDGTDGAIRRRDGLLEVPSKDGSNTRDLVDPTTGRTVARGGIERHVFEIGQRHARENSTLKQQVGQLQQYIGSANETARVARDLNVAPENQIVALRVMSDFMRDPVKTLEYLVAEVKSKGYQIPFLTDGVSPGMDLTAVQRLIENKMQPFTQAQQAQQQQERSRQAAAHTLDTFLDRYPEANSNLNVLTEMLQAAPDMDLQDAYIHMVSWAAQHGLDHTRPIGPQLQQRQYQHTQTQHAQQQQPTRAIPNGRSATSGAAPMNGAASFNENSSWADIINSAMDEARR